MAISWHYTILKSTNGTELKLSDKGAVMKLDGFTRQRQVEVGAVFEGYSHVLLAPEMSPQNKDLQLKMLGEWLTFRLAIGCQFCHTVASPVWPPPYLYNAGGGGDQCNVYLLFQLGSYGS